MPLTLRGYVALPPHVAGDFDHGDIHLKSGRVFVAHTANDTLDDWLRHFNFRAPARHRALADAYSLGALLLVVLERATRMGLHTVGDLVDAEKAQRWLGRVR